MPANVARPAALLISATLLAIAAEPLPDATLVSGMTAGDYYSYGSRPVPASYGDVDGDGYTDLALGTRIYWGSANGFSGSDFFEPEDPYASQQFAARAIYPYQALWIIPNIGGQEADGKKRADLVAVDTYGDGHILHVAPFVLQQAEKPSRAFSLDRVTLSEAFTEGFTLGALLDAPVVGDVNDDGIPDLAWLSDSDGEYARLAIGTGDSDGFAGSSSLYVRTGYAAVAGLPVGTDGAIDLLLIDSAYTQSPQPTVVRRYAHSPGLVSLSLLGAPAHATTLPGIRPRPSVSIGDIDGDELADAAIVSLNPTTTDFIISNDDATNPTLVTGRGIGWIVSDATGDGCDDVSWSALDTSQQQPVLYAGLVHGGDSGFASRVTTPRVDRPVPVNGQSLPAYPMGYNPGVSSFRLISVPKQPLMTPASVFSRKLLAFDFTGGDGFADSYALPGLYPVLGNGEALPVPAAGGPLVDPETFSVDFTPNGIFEGLYVQVLGYQAGDTLTYGTLPGSVEETTYDNVPAQTRSFAFVNSGEGSLSASDIETIVDGLIFTPGIGGSERSVTIVAVGKADPNDGFSAYAGGIIGTAQPGIDTGIHVAGLPQGAVSGPVELSISGGAAGTYRITSDGASVRSGGVVNGSLKIFVTPTRGGTITLVITDADGNTVPVTFQSVELPRTDLPAPSLALSAGNATVFGPVCPGTTSGLANLRGALAGADHRRTRGFAWDSASQTYTELPSEPAGGLTPYDGVFLASRVNLGLDFSGPAVPTGATILLRAEWNFVGMGPVDDNGTIRTSHSLSGDFSLLDLGGTAASFSDITLAYRWDGATYSTTDTIESGIGYWIRNVAAGGAPRLLKRNASAQVTKPRAATQFARDAGAPPAPPSTETKAESDGGSCGSGSGIATMLAGLLAFLRLRSRQR